MKVVVDIVHFAFTMESIMKEKIKRIYIDASVVYGAPTKEFSQDSKRFWQAFRNGEFTLIVSDVLEE